MIDVKKIPAEDHNCRHVSHQANDPNQQEAPKSVQNVYNGTIALFASTVRILNFFPSKNASHSYSPSFQQEGRPPLKVHGGLLLPLRISLLHLLAVFSFLFLHSSLLLPFFQVMLLIIKNFSSSLSHLALLASVMEDEVFVLFKKILTDLSSEFLKLEKFSLSPQAFFILSSVCTNPQLSPPSFSSPLP